MNQIIEKNLVQLKIIGKIPEDGKISTSNGISIEKNTILHRALRTLRSDSRHESVKMIKDIIFDTVDITNNMIQSRFLNIYNIKDAEHITHFEIEEFNKIFLLLKQYIQELKNVIVGLRHLQDTYQKDADISSKIEVYLDHIRYQIVQVEQKLSEVS